jgi:hypothetical protein
MTGDLRDFTFEKGFKSDLSGHVARQDASSFLVSARDDGHLV